MSPAHQAALDLADAGSGDVAARASRLLPDLNKLLEAVSSREGEQSRAAGLLLLDVANVNSKLAQANSNLTATLRRDALTILPRYATLDAVEATIWLDEAINRKGDKLGRSSQTLQHLQVHRRAAGDVVRAAPLWRDAINAAQDLGTREQLARDQLAVATKVAHANWILQARYDLLVILIERRTGKTPDDHEKNASLRTALTASKSNNSDLLQIAISSIPEIGRRLSWNNTTNNCNWINRIIVELNAKVSIALGTDPERKQALLLIVTSATNSSPFGTDYAGAVSNMLSTLAARTIDKDLYIYGLTTAGEDIKDDCGIFKNIPAICSLRMLAGALESMAVPQLAIPLLADALELADANGSNDEVKASLIVESAHLEWRFGTASEAPRLLERAEGLLRNDPSLIRSEANLKVMRLRALIADAQLDDRVALESFTRLVKISIEINRKRSSSEVATSVGNSGAGAAADTAYVLASELVHRHIRKRFCEACSGANGVAAPALEWMRAVFESEQNSGFIPSMEDFLLSWTLPTEAWPTDTQKWAARQFKASLSRQSGSTGIGMVPKFSALSKFLPKADEENRLRILALSQMISDETGGYNHFTQLREFIAFLNERDLEKKRALWNAYYIPVAEQTSDQFGTDADFYQTLDALARAAHASGYGLAARVVFESLVDKIAPGASKGTVSEGMDDLNTHAGVAVPALARIASYAIQRKEWPLAERLLDLAAATIQRRISTEWRSGNDRIASGLNDLRAAIRLTAQLRADMAEDPSARVALPEIQARLFSDLQMAMFSDTAVVAQSVDRKRVAANIALASAIRRRDQAEAAIAGAEKFRYLSEHYGLTSVEESVRTLSAERDYAAAEIRRLMPVAEEALSPAPVTLVTMRQALRDGEAMLLLHAGSHGVYGQLVTRSGAPVSWIAKIIIADLEQRIQAVREGIKISAGILPPFPFNDAFSLYQAILGPVEGKLGEVRRLLILADGPFHSLPWVILPTAPVIELPAAPDDMRAANIPWIARKYAITALTSAASIPLRETGQLGSQAKIAFAGIGNPVLLGPPGDNRGIDLAPAFLSSGSADVEALRQLRALPDTATEITLLGRMLSATQGDLKLGPEASETQVKRMPLANYRIITFATHGLIAGAITGANEPGLVLTPPALATKEDDGFLGASEIAALKLDADLVILSACNTAASDGRPRAEGLSGLARAFLAAGSRGIVVSHWAIPSTPTVEVITRMVKAKQEGTTWSVALQSAMLDVIDRAGPPEFAHPANWGAFLTVGLAGEARPQ